MLKYLFLVIDCGYFFILRNGIVYGEWIIYFNILRFKCDEGFICFGLIMRKC